MILPAWNWSAIVTKTGKVKTFWTSSGAAETESSLADYVAVHFPGLQFIKGEETEHGPARRMLMPSSAVQFGIKAIVLNSRKNGTADTDHFHGKLPKTGV